MGVLQRSLTGQKLLDAIDCHKSEVTSTMEETNVSETIKEIEDYLIPRLKLDTAEQALYYYLFRHTRLIGNQEYTIKTAFLENALLCSKNLIRSRLRSLKGKGCIEIIDAGWGGTKVKLLLPNEIPECVSKKTVTVKESIDIEKIDFYSDTIYRDVIFKREGGCCFYCLKRFTKENYGLDHVQSRNDMGSNNYRNVVAACHSCNSAKNVMPAEDFVRSLYRKGILNDKELEQRLMAIERLKKGELKPDV